MRYFEFRRLVLRITLALTLAVSIMPLTVLTSPVAAASETVTVPFTGGISAVHTTNSYSGPVTLTVSGTGQASGTMYTDAFYIYTDSAGNGVIAHRPSQNNWWALWINNAPADNLVQPIPAYRSDHTYTFTINAPGGQLTFGVGDSNPADNTGAYTITVNDNAGPKTDYTTGYSDGYAAGHTRGFTDGQNQCRRATAQGAFGSAIVSDYDRGYKDGFKDGYDAGFALGCKH